MNQQIMKIDNEIVKKLDESVSYVLGADGIIGFEKAYKLASGVEALRAALTDEYMKPIMGLMNTSIGFKTDRAPKPGSDVKPYSIAEVRECLISAVLKGVQPFNNQFNIISGQDYITKEGYKYILSKMKGLQYKIVYNTPKMEAEKLAVVIAKISWVYNGTAEVEELTLSIKINAGMGVDAVLGKAERKSRAWLHQHLTGYDLGDADVDEDDLGKDKKILKPAAGASLLGAAQELAAEANPVVAEPKVEEVKTDQPKKSTREQNIAGLFRKEDE